MPARGGRGQSSRRLAGVPGSDAGSDSAPAASQGGLPDHAGSVAGELLQDGVRKPGDPHYTGRAYRRQGSKKDMKRIASKGSNLESKRAGSKNPGPRPPGNRWAAADEAPEAEAKGPKRSESFLRRRNLGRSIQGPFRRGVAAKATDKTVVAAHGLNGPKLVSDYDPFREAGSVDDGGALETEHIPADRLPSASDVGDGAGDVPEVDEYR